MCSEAGFAANSKCPAENCRPPKLSVIAWLIPTAPWEEDKLTENSQCKCRLGISLTHVTRDLGLVQTRCPFHGTVPAGALSKTDVVQTPQCPGPRMFTIVQKAWCLTSFLFCSSPYLFAMCNYVLLLFLLLFFTVLECVHV